MSNSSKTKELVFNVSINKLFVQQRPGRIELYREIVKAPLGKELNILYSPHCELLREFINNKNTMWRQVTESRYWKLQKAFGRSDIEVLIKVKSLLWTFSSIQCSGLNKPIIVQKKSDEYFEIYDGHHRVAAFIVLNKTIIPAVLYEL